MHATANSQRTFCPKVRIAMLPVRKRLVHHTKQPSHLLYVLSDTRFRAHRRGKHSRGHCADETTRARWKQVMVQCICTTFDFIVIPLPYAELSALVTILEDAHGKGEKTLVFSRSVRLLTVLEAFLRMQYSSECNLIQYSRLDGSRHAPSRISSPIQHSNVPRRDG